MRILLCVAVATIATVGFAQSPLRTLTGGTNRGNQGGGLYFDITVNSTITFNRIDFLCGANTTAGVGTLDIFIGPSSYAGNVASPQLWTPVGSVSTSVGPSMVASGPISTPFALAPGNYGIALKSNAFSHGYTNGSGCTSTTTPGGCSNANHSTAELSFRGGAAQNNFLQGGVFTPRIFNGEIHYTVGGTPIRVAAWESYGAGCVAQYRSFYEHLPNPASLNIGAADPVTSILLKFNGISYDVTTGTSGVVAPLLGAASAATLAGPDSTFLATAVLGGPLTNNIPHPMGGVLGFATDLEISTDGYAVPTPQTMPNDNIPTVIGLLSGAQRWAPYWKNLDPVTGGAIHVEYNAAGTAVLVTWDAVKDNGINNTATSTFQIAFFFSGDVEYRYGSMSKLGGGSLPIIIGYTEGGGAVDPGNKVLTIAVPFSTFPNDNAPLTTEVDARPILGTNINLMMSNIPSGSLGGGILMGLIQLNPGVDLSVIAMPTCYLHLQSIASGTFTTGASTAMFPLTVPNIPSLNGANLYGQAVTLSPGQTPLGAVTSNAVTLKFGTL